MARRSRFDVAGRTGVSVFGSARAAPGTPEYELAREVGRRLDAAGFAVITGGGPGAMQAANRGAHEAGARSIGLHIDLSFEHRDAGHDVDVSLDFHYFFCARSCSCATPTRSWSCPAATAPSTSSSRRCA